MSKKLWVQEVQEEVEKKQEKENKTAFIVSAIWDLYSYTPPKGLFTESAEKIANRLKRDSKDLRQAMARLNFYINRAGSNLSQEESKKLERAKEVLRTLYKKKEAVGKPPKKWVEEKLKEIKKQNPGYSQDRVEKIMGHIWHHVISPSKKEQIVRRYEASITPDKVEKAEKLLKEWKIEDYKLDKESIEIYTGRWPAVSNFRKELEDLGFKVVLNPPKN